ncbi:MAG TPA: preprotein translocase subunit SecY [Anaerolineae bacterium]|nr:preprotein translocase subunit SecY [Anaerolineae bacterium]
MIESVRAALSLPDLRRRIMYTLGFLMIYRLVANIPVPGVDLDAWVQLTNQPASNGIIAFLDLLSGGAVSNFSVMAMGVYPYITASIIIQLLTPIVPTLEEWASEGESGRNRINRITYYLTVPLAFLQAISQINLVAAFGGGSVQALLPNFWRPGASAADLLPTLATLMAMVGGTMFAIWLGELITEKGIGQGISLIIFGGIVSAVPQNLAGVFALPDTQARFFTTTAFILLTVLTVFVIVVVQEGQRRIPVQYGRRVRGRKVYQGQSTYVPLKVNAAGMIPIIFAQSLMAFPGILAGLFLNYENFIGTAANWVYENFGQAEGFLYWTVYFFLVVGFTFFYTDVIVRQQNLTQTLQRQGGFIPGIRPGKRTEDYIMAVVRRITFVGAVFLGIVSILPGIMQGIGVLAQIDGIEQSALVISGSGLIIVVGVVIDTMRQLESQLLMRNYEGFIK